jgi:hypothetical protein
MIRSLAALAAGLAALALGGAAQAQNFAPSWGQPVYLDAWGRPVGGTPLSEVETRAYVGTGRWADGYHERPRVYVPARAPGYRYGYGYDGRYAYGRGHAHSRYRYDGYASRGHDDRDRRPWQGYRDEWGYQDDRHPSARRGWRSGRDGYRDGYDCGCGDVYLYDR